MLWLSGIPAKACAFAAAAFVCGSALYAAGGFGLPARAYADELDDVRAEIEEKTAEMQMTVEGIEAEKDRIAALDEDMKQILSDLADKQAEHSRLQADAASFAKVMYKDNADFNVFMLLEGSGSFEDFLNRLTMRDHVLSASSDVLDQLKQAQSDLDEAYARASADKDERESLVKDMKDKKKELDALVKDLKKREKQLDVKQQAALAQAAAAAHELAVTFATDSSVNDAAAQAGNSEHQEGEDVAADLSVEDGADSGQAADGEPADAQAASASSATARTATSSAGPDPNDSGWNTGYASAYGGSSDKSTPNPGKTATGTVCDDWSVGVAVPLAWGPSKYYGKYVEISYNGVSLVAPVVDCGGMGGGSRALDLQPGVFKAFGCNTCDDWGVREVHYRFL